MSENWNEYLRSCLGLRQIKEIIQGKKEEEEERKIVR